MPEALEKKLRREGIAKGLTGARLDRYVYGTMRKQVGWVPSHQKKKKKTTTKRKKT